MRKIITLACFVFLVVLSGSVSAATYTVCSSGCDYTSIQAAVNAASNGDTISVGGGTYNENVGVTKSVNIIGAGADVTTISAASRDDHVFEVTADSVNISGFTVTGSSSAGIYLYGTSNGNISNNVFSYNDEGIYLYSSNYNTITGNDASNNEGYGILLESSSYNTITGNIASNNNEGIFLSSSSDYNTITGNIANSNYMVSGIYLGSSSYNTITGNNVNSNGYGILIYPFSEYNIITGNIASNNDAYGIELMDSSNNTISNNHFNNANNIGFTGTIYSNDWNTAKTLGTNIIGGSYLGGNFWANPGGTGFSETCTDGDSDGICDSSYTLTSGNVDYLPLALGSTASTTTTTVPPTTTTTVPPTTTTTTTTTTTAPTTTTTTLPPGNGGNGGNDGNVGNVGNTGNVGNFDGNGGNVGNFEGNVEGNTDTGTTTTNEDLLTRLWQWMRGSGRGR